MLYLIAGILLWALAHMVKRLMPGFRRDLTIALGEQPSRGLVAAAIAAALILMVVGFIRAETIPVYAPLPGMGHVNNLLMVVAIFAMGIGPAGGRLNARFRHPMLFGVILWGVAHLLVNGDLASILLFGSMILWALLEIRLINQQEGPWERPMPGNAVQDGKLFLGSVFVYIVIAGIHWLADHNPFLGTYG